MSVSQVLGQSFAIMKSRFGPMFGLWLLFFVLSIVASIVFVLILGGGMGLAALTADSTNMLGAMGGGMIAGMIIFYILYILIYLAQAAALNSMANPWKRPSFAQAFSEGARSALTLLGVAVIAMIAYIVASIPLTLVFGLFAFAGTIGSGFGMILIFGLMAYVGCRLALIVPIVVTEGVRNPLTAIARSWSLSRGHALTIFLSFLGLLAFIGLVFLVLWLVFSSSVTVGSDPDITNALGIIVFLVVGLTVFGAVVSMVSATIQSVLLGNLSDIHGENLADQFA